MPQRLLACRLPFPGRAFVLLGSGFPLVGREFAAAGLRSAPPPPAFAVPAAPTRSARSLRNRCSGPVPAWRAAARYASRAPSVSPAISSRCARTALSRWLPAIHRSRSRGSSSRSPSRGPLTIAIATARFSRTAAPGAICSSRSYRARICGQSVSPPSGVSTCTAAMAACSR
ncbi:hypothetical protein GA0115246_1001316 [Streptomyces sp. SolWspMP-sol7th]|nr:hypothetical protein GA0115246_1001316 [Streptomyces sp. SolWspMP-sol7th]